MMAAGDNVLFRLHRADSVIVYLILTLPLNRHYFALYPSFL